MQNRTFGSCYGSHTQHPPGSRRVAARSPTEPKPKRGPRALLKPIGYSWSYMARTIGPLVPIWRPCIGFSSFVQRSGDLGAPRHGALRSLGSLQPTPLSPRSRPLLLHLLFHASPVSGDDQQLPSEAGCTQPRAAAGGSSLEDAMAELDMDRYDDDDDNDGAGTISQIFGRGRPGLLYYRWPLLHTAEPGSPMRRVASLKQPIMWGAACTRPGARRSEACHARWSVCLHPTAPVGLWTGHNYLFERKISKN
jgi:hypothetical protein